MFYKRVACVCLVCLPLCKEEGSSPMSTITEGRDMGYNVVPINVFVGSLDGDYVSQLPYVWYYVGDKSCFQHVCEECEFKRVYVC